MENSAGVQRAQQTGWGKAEGMQAPIKKEVSAANSTRADNHREQDGDSDEEWPGGEILTASRWQGRWCQCWYHPRHEPWRRKHGVGATGDGDCATMLSFGLLSHAQGDVGWSQEHSKGGIFEDEKAGHALKNGAASDHCCRQWTGKSLARAAPGRGNEREGRRPGAAESADGILWLTGGGSERGVRKSLWEKPSPSYDTRF